MGISEIDTNSMINETSFITDRDPIYCKVSENEKPYLFNNLGIIAKFVRNFLREKLLPLSNASDYMENILKRENWISTDLFWKVPFADLRYPRQMEIREHFVLYDQYVIVKSDNKEIKLKCRVIEPKDCPLDGCLNHMVIQGNISTLDNNMPAVYPYLDSYMKERDKNPDIAPARFIIFSHYDHKIADTETKKEKDYLPEDITEWGFVFKKAFESLVDRYGKFQMLAAHSLGNIPAVELLKYIKKEEFSRLFPQTVFLAQGPSSTYEVSKNYPFDLECYPWGWAFFGLGPILYFLSKWTGWNIQIDKTLTDLVNNFSKDTDIQKELKNRYLVLSQVKYDYYFPEKASLCGSDKLDDLEDKINLYRLNFNPPLSWATPRAQHNYSIGLLQRQDLIQERVSFEEGRHMLHLNDPKKIIEQANSHSFIMRHGESIVDTVLRSAWSSSSPASLEGRVEILNENSAA